MDREQSGWNLLLRLATQQAGYQRSKKTATVLDLFILHGLQEKVLARLVWFVEFHWDGVRQKVFAWLGWPVDLYIILNRT